MPTTELNGTSLYYEDSGPGSTGETIAFSHGLLWGTELFAPQIAALRARYRCLAWDHRGQGKSAADQRNCIGMELVWQDAVAVIERFGGAPVHFVGLSMGGFVAMRMAARRPDLVRSLILLETSADPEPLENVRRYRVLTAVTRAFGTRVTASRVAPIMLGRTILEDPTRREELARYVGLMTRRRDIWRAVNGVIDRAGVEGELGRIRAPTTVIVGSEDVATPLTKAQRIAGAIAGARLVEIPRAGHSSTVEEPVAVTAAIDQALRNR
ncbi:MAG: alpha/beta hydrolase fold having protein [Myxococcales bacterium]|nr:alpha/beta hydrolase fold having protein [Myxococcales bacterium]